MDVMPWIRGILAVPVALAVLLAASTTQGAQCVRPGGGGGCFSGIQAALAATPPGGTVLVHPGTYHEALTIDNPGVVLAGTGGRPDGVRIEGGGLGAHGIEITAPDVTVRNLLVTGAGIDGVHSTAPGTRLERLHVADSVGSGIDVVEHARVRSCRVRNAGSWGIHGLGANIRVSGSLVAGTWGIRLISLGGRVLGTALYDTTVGSGIEVSGDATVVRGCTVRNAPGVGVHVTGPFADALAPRVTRNRVSGTTSDGIAVVMRGPGTIAGNTLADVALTGLDGFEILCNSDCRGGRVVRNAVRGTTGPAGRGFTIVSLEPGLLVGSNRASECAGAGFALAGPRIELRNNSARMNLGAGYEIQSDGAGVRGNRALDNGADGFLVGSGPMADALLLRNGAFGNLGTGIRVTANASGTQVRRNAARGNTGDDFCDDGIGTTLAGNRFGSVCP